MRLAFFVMAFLFCALVIAGQQQLKLDAELSRIGTDTALLVPSQAVDEYPLWSPDGRYLAANVEGKWYRVDLLAVALEEAKWRGSLRIGVLSKPDALAPISDNELGKWKSVSKMYPRKLSTPAGSIELRNKELSTALLITPSGGKPETRWTSDMENCHSLVASPDKKHVAYICELNGVVVMRWP